MAFDFAKAIKDSVSDIKNDKLFLFLLGVPTGGKSYALGTLGVKTLLLYTGAESHGARSASVKGGDSIVAVRLDKDGANDLSADDALNRLNAILDDVAGIKAAKFGAIALDGATEIEALIRGTTKFKTVVKTTFDEGPATMIQFRSIINKLKRLQDEAGTHVVMTGIINAKEFAEDGTILDAQPQLHGYQVATGIVQQFPDVMIVGRMTKNEKISHRIQLHASASKVTKDFKTGEAKKIFAINPRLTGANIIDLGATMEADLGRLIKLKAGETV